ncbi:hypothetical protein AB7M56_000097 [Bradyrhizobium elkanii]|jgi:hypothetical protein|uniref:Uncharacterized protein n=1 Tax=Bradyrhizobium elkanii TaxID=29448 RepID=A0A8I1Y520_BRAEL|nr:hypothetical protein [Bradyrhizobium elkanii]MCP1975633.1 hypothetical protein [Bradyrhizobium elkanii]MCS3482398.1 hypothetical protein [Bradyrhizobium elkanii]MCS3525222.1 hypothetical protein [Bradyrhizobium elkanii]MCS4075875.1 hypothetical protein [Bradyrhizobium elkanii]
MDGRTWLFEAACIAFASSRSIHCAHLSSEFRTYGQMNLPQLSQFFCSLI